MNSENFRNEDSKELITIYRSLYILKKKFEKYKNEISKIYTKFFVKDKNNYNNIRCKIIKISSFKPLLEEICHLVNMSIVKISSSNELFISDLVVQKIQNEKLNDSIEQINNYITDKLKYYNNIFYTKKIKPAIDINIIDNIADDFTDYYPISEYNKKGNLIYYHDQMKELNKKYSSVFKSKEIDLDKENELNQKEKDILYIETLPVIIADFIQENPQYIISNTEFQDNELNNEIKSLFDSNLLKKIEKENKNLKEQINIPTFKTEMKLQELYKEQLAIENNLKLYSNLLNEKKKSGHDVKYIEEFLSKLNKEKDKLDKKVKKEEEKSQKLNSKRSNYPISNNSTDSNITKSNILIRNKSQLNKLTQEQKLINSLKEIFDFYANQHNPMASAPTFDEIAFRKINLDLAEFSRFCVEFEIPISKAKMAELFKKNTSNRRDMSFNEFRHSLEKIGQAMNDSKKDNLEKKIKLYKDLLEKMNLNDDIIQDFKRKSVFIHEINLNNPNKNNIRNSHRLNTKNASALLDDKKKLYNNELKEFENELYRLKNLSFKEVFEEFIKFVGVNDPKIYRQKMKGFIIPFHDMTERVLQFNGNYKLKKISRNDVIEKMKRDLQNKNKDNSSIKYNQYYLKKIREQKEKEEMKNKLYEKRMKEFMENKKRKIAFLKEEDRKEKERLKRAKLTPKEIQKEIELKKEKERLELEKQKEEEERKRQEEIKQEEDRKKNVFSFERIEKSGLNELYLNNELKNDLFIEDDSQNSDEEILNLFGNKDNNKNKKEEIESIDNNQNYPINEIENKNEEVLINLNNEDNNKNIKEEIESINNNKIYPIKEIEKKNEEILINYNNIDINKNIKEDIESINNENYPINEIENNNEEIMNPLKNDFNFGNNNNYNNNFNTIDSDNEVENVLLTQQGNKNIVLKNNIDKPYNRRIQSFDYDNNNPNKKSSITISTDIKIPYLNSNNDLSSENIILSYNNNGSQSERRSKSKTFIKTGENIIKGNKRQVSAFYGKNYNNPITISSLNENKELSKKKKLLFAGKVQKNQENLLNNQIIGNAKLIKKIEKIISYNNSDYNLRRKYDN